MALGSGPSKLWPLMEKDWIRGHKCCQRGFLRTLAGLSPPGWIWTSLGIYIVKVDALQVGPVAVGPLASG